MRGQDANDFGYRRRPSYCGGSDRPRKGQDTWRSHLRARASGVAQAAGCVISQRRSFASCQGRGRAGHSGNRQRALRRDALTAPLNQRDFEPVARRFWSRAMDPETSADRTKSVKARMWAYASRLPASIKAEAEKIAREDGTSLNQFVASAVAEKVAAIRTLNYFAPFKARANLDEFDRIMQRTTNAPPQPDDVMRVD